MKSTTILVVLLVILAPVVALVVMNYRNVRQMESYRATIEWQHEMILRYRTRGDAWIEKARELARHGDLVEVFDAAMVEEERQRAKDPRPGPDVMPEANFLDDSQCDSLSSPLAGFSQWSPLPWS